MFSKLRELAKGPIVYYVERGGGVNLEERGYNFKTIPFWGVSFSLLRNVREV